MLDIGILKLFEWLSVCFRLKSCWTSLAVSKFLLGEPWTCASLCCLGSLCCLVYEPCKPTLFGSLISPQTYFCYSWASLMPNYSYLVSQTPVISYTLGVLAWCSCCWYMDTLTISHLSPEKFGFELQLLGHLSALSAAAGDTSRLFPSLRAGPVGSFCFPVLLLLDLAGHTPERSVWRRNLNEPGSFPENPFLHLQYFPVW